MNNKPKHCVFIDPRFFETFNNIKSWSRNDNVFDCTSVKDLGNYLNIVAVHQKFPDIVHNLDIWVPTAFVQAVIWDGYGKSQIGFGNHQTQDNNSQDQVDQT